MKTMTIEKVRGEYFLWLISQVSDLNDDDFDYDLLLSKLHKIKFILPDKHITMDVNRIIDAMDMRSDFFGHMEKDGVYIPIGNRSVLPDDVSVLEVLIALARRIEADIMYDPNLGNRTKEWFWIMMENLDLMQYSNTYVFADKVAEKEISELVDKFMLRTFEPTGEGSLFPLNNPNFDQRKMDIWSQMTNYLSERGDSLT